MGEGLNRLSLTHYERTEMAKFLTKNNKVTFIIRPQTTSVIPNAQGIPTAISDPGKKVTIENGELITTDPEIIARLRADSKYGTEFLREITEDDEAAIEIRKKKDAEAEEEIKKTTKSKKKT